mmetsp:Transcript_44131/g.115972  ORF Transcript_44131/g.115972 Transcript_44131/m.115972 type:complete len:222 (+) Transcript_44131:33-698(+)
MADDGSVGSASANLDAAGERQRKIHELKAISQAALDALAEARANKGRGRPSADHSRRKAAHEAKIARLERNLLPGESDAAAAAARSTEELRASAAQHSQHHAASSRAPSGFPSAQAGAQARAQAGAGVAAADGGGAAEDDAGDGGAAEGDEDANLKQFYRVSPAQHAFNGDAALPMMRFLQRLAGTVVRSAPYSVRRRRRGWQPQHRSQIERPYQSGRSTL